MWWLFVLACSAPVAETPVVEKPVEKASVEEAPAAPKKAMKAAVGQPAPDFTLTDLDGNEHALSSYKGKTVVLEWFNPGCPYVVQAHGPGGGLEKTAGKVLAEHDDVVWLAINSGAAGKQGHGKKVNADAVAKWGLTHPILLDESGKVGHLYGAATTPQMAIVNPAGTMVYMGALSNAPMGEAKGTLREHLLVALDESLAGKPVSIPQTKPWGCSVKY